MKRPTVASQKKVTPDNLARLGVERLAELLAEAAAARPDLKRRLRMELAAQHGAEHLAVEIDKRLGSLETSRSKVSWRQRPGFVRDLDGLRTLISERMAQLDRVAALNRLWIFMDTARRIGGRVRDRDGELAAVYQRAAADIGVLCAQGSAETAADGLAQALVRDPRRWADWLGPVLEHASAEMADAALRQVSQAPEPSPVLILLIRQLADAAGNIDAVRATYTAAALKSAPVAAAIADRLLAAGRTEEAGAMLQASGPAPTGRGREAQPVDFDWETVWIDYLERSGQAEAAQTARWTSFERTLSGARVKAFMARLTGFDDVEAESRAFDLAAAHPDAGLALAFLMEWPAPADAARMIMARADEIQVPADKAEAWAGTLQARYPPAAHLLLRRAAAAAFKRRDFATSERLTQEADAIEV
jgi:hypothetical protein